MSLAQEDEALLVAPERTFVLEYRELHRIWRWFWRPRRRKRVTLRTMTLVELQQVQRTYRELEKVASGGLDMTLALAVLIGPVAFRLTPEQVAPLWTAHCELNRIPFERTRPEKEANGSPMPDSSADSSAGPSTSTTASS